MNLLTALYFPPGAAPFAVKGADFSFPTTVYPYITKINLLSS